jgi:DNA-binding NarL/FixJ family response regulator
MKHSIAIIDDHILIAKAITGIVENFNQFEVLYECENGKALQEKLAIKKNIPDIVLLDISMPIMDGFETAKWLKEAHPQILIIALSMQDDEQSVIKMIKNGANGYLLKNVHPTELEKALNAIVKNGTYYPEWATSKIMASISKTENTISSIFFTDREKEFLQYSVTEMNYNEIAEKMFCSPRTVESYRDSLFKKLDLKSRVGLAVYAIKNGYSS